MFRQLHAIRTKVVELDSKTTRIPHVQPKSRKLEFFDYNRYTTPHTFSFSDNWSGGEHAKSR